MDGKDSLGASNEDTISYTDEEMGGVEVHKCNMTQVSTDTASFDMWHS